MSVQPPDQEAEGGAGSAATGWTPLGRSALGVRAAVAGAADADEGREAEPRWAGVRASVRPRRRPGGGAGCGRRGRSHGGGRSSESPGGVRCPRRDAASEGTPVDGTPPPPSSSPS